MTWPTIRAQVAFDTAPLADVPAWTTIHEGTSTQRAMTATTRTGRQFELDPFQPGRMTLKLDNSDRRFDPLHAAGPYYGKLLPRKRTRLQADWGTYLNLTGAAGSMATTPDTAALDITGDIDIRVRVALDDWTPGASSVLVAKAMFGTNQASYVVAVNTDGTLTLFTSPDGTAGSGLVGSSTTPVPAADGTAMWVRATLDVDNGAGSRVYRFYTSTDVTHDHAAVSWTQLGTTVTTAGATSIFAGTSVVAVGAFPEDASRSTGRVYAATVLSGIGGTVVVDLDFTDGNQFTAGTLTGTDATSRVWTVSTPASLVAVTYDLFSGFVDTWPQSYAQFMGTSEMTATDGFKILSRIDLTAAYEETIRDDAPVGWWRMGDNTPTYNLCADSSGYGHDGYYKGSPASIDGIVDGTSDAAVDFDGVNDRAILDPAVIPTAGPVSFEAWIRTSTLPTADSPIVAIFDTGASAAGMVFGLGVLASTGYPFVQALDSTGLGSSTAGAVSVADGAPHHLVGTWDAADKKARLYVDGVLVNTSTASTDVTLYAVRAPLVPRIAAAPITTSWSRFDGIIDEVAMYDLALTDDQVTAHFEAGADPWTGDTTGERVARVLDLAGWPAADRDLDTGRSIMGPYLDAESNALSIAQRAEATEGGALWQAPDGRITFRDRHAAIQDWNATVSQAAFTDDGAATNPQHYTVLDLSYDDTLIINEASVTWDDGTETSRDQTSVDAYTRSAVRVETSLTTAPEARDRGDWLLERYKNPAVRPERVVLRPSGDQRLWRHCLARKIGDRVTVRRKPQNTGTAIQFDATIESINHRITDGKNTWETEFGLSPTALDLGWLILDDPTKGLLNTGKLAY